MSTIAEPRRRICIRSTYIRDILEQKDEAVVFIFIIISTNTDAARVIA